MIPYMKMLFLVFVFGFCIGAIGWISFYETHKDPRVFRAQSSSDTRRVLSKMIRMQQFEKVKALLRSVYPKEEPVTHGVGHILGEEAYRVYGAKAFGLCDSIFNFGCFHGVVDMAIRTHGLHMSLAKDLFDACEKEMNDPSPCIHPIGHASTILTEYNALEAFHLCDMLYAESKVAFSCWNGAMMEYINRSAPNAPNIPYGDPNNVNAPCDIIPPKYVSSCVSMHVSYLESLWQHDFSKIFQYCLNQADGDVIDNCVDATGSLIAQAYFLEPQRIIAMCEHAYTKKSVCLMGAIVPLVSAKQADVANQLCDRMSEKNIQEACHLRVQIIFQSI